MVKKSHLSRHERREAERARPLVQQFNHPLPLWLRYLRSLGIMSSCIGGGVLMWEHFCVGVVFIYLAFVLLVLDFWFEPDLKLHPRLKISLILAVIAACFIFTFEVVLVSALLETQALDFGSGSPDENGKVGDIQWKNDYRDIRLSVNNHTDNDYTNLRIDVSTDLFIAQVGRLGKCLDGSVEPAIQIGGMHFQVPGKPEQTINLSGSSYCKAWTIRCDKIRRNDKTDFLLAVVNLDKFSNLFPHKKPSSVKVNISYESMGHRRRKIEREMQF
jgi:hypothetical protein